MYVLFYGWLIRQPSDWPRLRSLVRGILAPRRSNFLILLTGSLDVKETDLLAKQAASILFLMNGMSI